MNDSADMRDDHDNGLKEALSEAERRLRSGLDQLERRLTPITREMETMRKEIDEAESFSEDRAQLAQRLDEVTAQMQEQSRASQDIIAAKDAHINEQQETLDMIVTEFDGQLQAILTQVAQALGEG